MDIGSKETLCSRCIHKSVCAYSNGSGYKKVIDFDFIGDISVPCRYYQNVNNVR